MDQRKLRNRILLFLVVAGIVAYVLVRLSGREPVAKIAAVMPVRDNLVSSISSNGKVEPISPFVMRAPLDTFVDKVTGVEGQQVKKGQLLLELNVRDARAQLDDAEARLLRARDELRAAQSGGKSDEAARVAAELAKAQGDRDRLLRNHDALDRLIAKQAATRDELAANDLALSNAQAEVKRALCRKTGVRTRCQAGCWTHCFTGAANPKRNCILEGQGRQRASHRAYRWNFVFAAGEDWRLREDRRSPGGNGGLASRSRSRLYR